MKSIFKHIVFASALMFAACGAHAQTMRHEIDPGTASRINLSGGDRYSHNVISAHGNIGYAYGLSEMLQLKGTFEFGLAGGTGKTTNSFGLSVGPVFNFSEDRDIRGAAFVEFLVGGEGSHSDIWTGTFLASLNVGKRFRLGENISYKPSLAYQLSRVQGRSFHSLLVTPFSFSIHF